MKKLIYSLVILFAASALSGAELLSGPMVGHTTATSSIIWVETDQPATVQVHYWVENRPNPVVRGTAEARTSDTAPHTGNIALMNLPPNGDVYYELEIDGKAVRPHTAQNFSLLPAVADREHIPNFSVGFGSCINPMRVPLQPVWTQVGVYRPDLFLFIGDNNYMPQSPAEYNTSEETVRYMMSRYHRYLRDVPGLRSILATTPSYAIWDDHDYGPNNSDRTFRWKDLSADLFKQYWPNPPGAVEDAGGIYYSFSIADVEFFMLDDRYYRDPNEDPERKTMLGQAQLQWLQSGLKNSDATFKVIANGGVMTVDRHDNAEYWARFGTEREEFLKWMYRESINGVLFISGDWHVGSLCRLEFTEDGYPLYELISSNAGVNGVQTDRDHSRYFSQTSGHNRRFSGPIINDIRDYNFGMLRFEGSAGDRSVVLQIIDHHGEVRAAHRLHQKDLSPDWDN